MRIKHCSEEQLLAYLDGELGYLSRYRCARHLRKCWKCREQLAAVEKQIERLARLAREEQARVCPEAAAAKRRFLAAVAYEPAIPDSSARIVNWTRVAASLGLGALAFAAGIGYWHHTSGSVAVVQPPAEAHSPALPSLMIPAPAVETEARAVLPQEHVELQPAPLKRWSPESLAEAELEATSVLSAHAAQSLAAVTFERDPVRGLHIEGIVEDQSRRDILLSGFNVAIRSAPWSAHLTVASDLRPAVLPSAAAPERTVHARISPAEAWLRDALQTQGDSAVAPRVNAIVNGALRRAGTAAAAAWTLHRLAERFPDSTVAGLSPRGRELLARLATIQLNQLREAAAAEREWMAVWFPDAVPAAVPDLVNAVSQWERLANRLMTCCDEPPADTRAALHDLAALLSGIEKHLNSGDFIARHWTSLAKEHLTQAQPAPK